MKQLGLFLIVVAAVSGCAMTPGLVPAIGGKSKMNVTAYDVTGGAPNPELVGEPVNEVHPDARFTKFEIEAKLPAGVDVADAVSFLANETTMSLNKDGAFTSQGQAGLNALIAELTARNIDNVTASMTTLISAALAADAANQAAGVSQGHPLFDQLMTILPAILGAPR